MVKAEIYQGHQTVYTESPCCFPLLIAIPFILYIPPGVLIYMLFIPKVAIWLLSCKYCPMNCKPVLADLPGSQCPPTIQNNIAGNSMLWQPNAGVKTQSPVDIKRMQVIFHVFSQLPPHRLELSVNHHCLQCCSITSNSRQCMQFFFYWKGGYTERRDREEDLPSDDSLPK